jgi:hypothetical protein
MNTPLYNASRDRERLVRHVHKHYYLQLTNSKPAVRSYSRPAISTQPKHCPRRHKLGDVAFSIITLTDVLNFFNLQVNIFIDDQTSVRLADFGLAIVIEATTGGSMTTSGPKGTVAWMAPERISPEGPTPRLVPPMDIYSFGILCHTVCLLFS